MSADARKVIGGLAATIGALLILAVVVQNSDKNKKYSKPQTEQVAQVPNHFAPPSADEIANKVAANLNGELPTKLQKCQSDGAVLEDKVQKCDNQTSSLQKEIDELKPFKAKYEAVLAGTSPILAQNAVSLNDNGYELMTINEYLKREENLGDKYLRISGRPVAVTFAGGDVLDILIEKDRKMLHCSSFSGGSDKQSIHLKDIPASQLYNELVLLIEEAKKEKGKEITVYGEGNTSNGFLIHSVKLSPTRAYDILKIERKQ